MFKPGFCQKRGGHQKKGGPGWFKRMIYLPPPFCRKKRFWPKNGVYDLPFFAPPKKEVDHTLCPLDGLNI